MAMDLVEVQSALSLPGSSASKRLASTELFSKEKTLSVSFRCRRNVVRRGGGGERRSGTAVIGRETTRLGLAVCRASTLLELVVPAEFTVKELKYELPRFDVIQRKPVDLVIVGAGSACLAVANRVLPEGLGVCFTDPAPQSVWPNKYRVWVDEFEVMDLLDCLDYTWGSALVYLDDINSKLLERPYGRVKLRSKMIEACISRGVQLHQSKVLNVQHDEDRSYVSCDDGTMVEATAVHPLPVKTATATGGSHRRRAKTKLKEPEETVKDEQQYDIEEEQDWPPLVCCFGEALHEFVPTVRVSNRQMDPEIYSSWKGLQWSPPEFVRAPGSSAANVAIALARLGGRVAFIGKVGDDEFGHTLVSTLNTNHVQTRGVKFDPNVNTGVSWMRLTCGTGAGTKMICEKPSAESCLLDTEINLDIIKEACLLQCSSISLTNEPLRSTLVSAINKARKQRADVFFDLNLPLPYWKSRDETWSVIQPVWEKSTMFELTKQELEFLLGEEIYEQKRKQRPVYYAKSAAEMKPGRDEYHYMPEELLPIWHKHIRILFVTDGTYRIHYYTQDFHGSVEGTEDVLLAPFSCDRTGSGDALVAALIKKLTTQPELLHDQIRLEKALRFAVCAGIISQWTIGAIRGYPTESAAQNLTEQVYQPSMV